MIELLFAFLIVCIVACFGYLRRPKEKIDFSDKVFYTKTGVEIRVIRDGQSDKSEAA